MSRMPDVKMEKAKKAYQAGLAKCPEKDTPVFLKTVLKSLRWWQNIEEKDKAEIKKQTRQDDEDQTTESGEGKKSVCVNLDKDFLDVVSTGSAKKMISLKAVLEQMVKDVKQDKLLKKIGKKAEKGSDKHSKKRGKYSKKKRSLLDDYGYDSSAGDGYEEGESLHEELEVEYDLDDDLEGFRVHDFQLDGDSIDTRNDWEEAKNNPWDGKKRIDADDDAEPED